MNMPLPQQNEIDEAMNSIDLNKDGKINFAEYKVNYFQFLTNKKEIR